MREKIARALAKSRDYREYDEVGGAPAWRLFENDADAVLDALMEPTEGMLRAGDKVLCEEIVCNCDEREIFRAMIQAARDGK